MSVWWLIASGSGLIRTDRISQGQGLQSHFKKLVIGSGVGVGGVSRAFKTGLKMGGKDSQYLVGQPVPKSMGQEPESGR